MTSLRDPPRTILPCLYSSNGEMLVLSNDVQHGKYYPNPDLYFYKFCGDPFFTPLLSVKCPKNCQNYSPLMARTNSVNVILS